MNELRILNCSNYWAINLHWISNNPETGFVSDPVAQFTSHAFKISKRKVAIKWNQNTVKQSTAGLLRTNKVKKVTLTFLIRTVFRLILAAFDKREFSAESEVLLLAFQCRLLHTLRNCYSSFISKNAYYVNFFFSRLSVMVAFVS